MKWDMSVGGRRCAGKRSVMGHDVPKEVLGVLTHCWYLLLRTFHLCSSCLHELYLRETGTLNPVFSGCTGGGIHKMLLALEDSFVPIE